MASHTLNFPGANLNTTQVTTSQLTMNTVNITSAFSLDNICVKGNTTSRVVQFTNPTTAFVTTANVDVGGELQVAGNATVSSNLTVGEELTVSGDATVSSNLTVTGNATVTGDLNVSGALGILDAIYPVGTVINRATAITDTHLDGKFKAFLAAPNQRWELLSTTGPTFSTNISFAVDYNSPTATYDNQLIPLTLIHTNVGSSWDSASNTFIVPADGNYVFGINYQQDDDHSRIEIRRTRGGTTTTIGDLVQYSENPGFVHAGFFNYGETLMAPLQANDIVFLWADGNQGGGVTLQPPGSATHPSTGAISHLHFYGHFVSPAVETTTYVYKRIAD